MLGTQCGESDDGGTEGKNHDVLSGMRSYLPGDDLQSRWEVGHEEDDCFCSSRLNMAEPKPIGVPKSTRYTYWEWE